MQKDVVQQSFVVQQNRANRILEIQPAEVRGRGTVQQHCFLGQAALPQLSQPVIQIVDARGGQFLQWKLFY